MIITASFAFILRELFIFSRVSMKLMLILDLDLSQGKYYVLLCFQCCMKKLTNVFT